MKGPVRVALQATVMLTFAAGAVLALAPSQAGLIGRLWLIGLALAWSLALVGFVPGARPDLERRPPLWRRRRASYIDLPPDLESLQLAVELSMSSEFDRHYRLRPWVIETAHGLLASRQSVSLALHPEQAAALLGPDVWELVRPERPEPPGRGRRELDPAELDRLVAALERINR